MSIENGIFSGKPPGRGNPHARKSHQAMLAHSAPLHREWVKPVLKGEMA